MTAELEGIKPTMEQVVEKEIKDKEKGNVFGYLNNFYCKLPFPGGRDISDLKRVRGEPIHYDPDESRRKRPLDSPAPHEQDLPQEQRLTNRLEEGFSAKYVTKTRFEFLDDVAEAIKDSHVDRLGLERFVWDCHERNRQQITESNARRYLLPIYIKLREMGYTHDDLNVS
jgi:hypothetical protein